MDGTIADKMRRRRQAMEATYTSDAGSYQSDNENAYSRGRNSTRDDITEIQSLDEDTNIQTIGDDNDDMIEALQTRRKQRKEELVQPEPGPSGTSGWADSPGTNQDRPPLPRSLPVLKDSQGEPVPVKGQRFMDTVEAATKRANEASGGKLNASIRERLRSRVKGIQAKAAEREGLPERKLRGLRDLPIPNRFEDSKADEDDYDPQLKASMASAREWRKMKSKQKKPTGFPTDEEAYNFFVGTGMTMDEEEKQRREEPRPEEASGDVALDLFDEVTMTHWEKPPYIPQREQLDKESNLYAYPSTLPAPRENKVTKGLMPRSLEDEGFYVGTPPQVDQSRLCIMENRLLLPDQEDRSWFDENGDLKRLPDPVRSNPSRFAFAASEDVNPALETFWGKAIVTQFDGRYINGDGAGKRYQLDIDVSKLAFTHHPLFSKEHVLVSRLQQLYNQYCVQMRKGIVEHLTSKLITLREALSQLQELPEKVKKARRSSISQEVDRRRKFYKTEIKQIRRQRDEEEYRDRMLLKSIFKYWQDVKQLREMQGHTNTHEVLKVIRQVVNKEEEKHLRLKEVTEELQEQRDEFEEQYRDKYAAFEAQVLEWKKHIKQRKRKAQRRLEQSQAAMMDEQEQPEDTEPLPRPEPPTDFDEAAALSSIEERLKKCRRRPGEAILTPELQSGTNVTVTEQCPRAEQLRRAEIKNAKYFIKVMFNDKEVSRTAVKSLSSDFTIQFGQILNMQVLQWPESIKLQIFDANGWTTTLLTELYVPIPEASMVAGTVDIEPFEFSSDHFMTYKHDGVGSGINIDLNIQQDVEPDPPVTLLTSGILYSSVSWGIDNDGRPLAPPSKSHGKLSGQSAIKQHDALSALGAAGVVDMEMLISWITEANLDPNDPTNADILNLAKLMTGSQKEGLSRPKYFRLNQLEEETDFATNEELDNCKRFRLLQLRDQGVAEFKNYKMIPLEDKYISDTLFEGYEKRIKGEEPIEEEGEVSHRAKVSKFLVQARKNVLARSQIAKRQLDLTDVVIEDEVPDIGTLGARIGQLFAKRHPLKPERKERKRIGGQNLSTVKQVKILINIVRAFDVPTRTETLRHARRNAIPGPSESATSGQGQGMFAAQGRGLQASYNSRMSAQPQQLQQGGYNAAQPTVESLVRPFVEVVFQGNFVRTSVADGPLPNWNEELVVPFRAPNNDYSTENLQTVKENVYINLFDEVIVDMLQDERQRGTNIHQRVEKFWLGGVEIPFSTVYFNSKVKGLMRINTPPVLLGYQPSRTTSVGFSGATQSSGSKCETYLQLFVTIEPQLQPAQPIAEKFETNESDTLVHNAQVWLSAVRASHAGREYKTMVSDLDGKKVFVTRYIRPQKHPDGLITDTTLPAKQVMRILARYVSLIPYIPDSVQFPDLCDIWTTSEQFLSMLAGDEEEHAILLCNYFLSLGKKAWVVLGNGIPEGSTAYVLSLDGATYQLWNASTGECYDMHDVRCPLQSIGCLIDETNILANVQKESHPSKLDLNFVNAKAWKPFFSKNYPNPGLFSLQIERPNYHETDVQYFVNLQDKIERLLKDKLMEWRPRFVTRWNRYCTQAFRNLLTNIEQKFAMGQSIEDHHSELEQVISSYKLTGFPLQMQYTDIQPVLDSVYSTGVHNCEDPEVEFSLAVHIHPYPNSVVAVWIYVGRLVKKIAY
eukprot:Seg2891.1 transcript_id=Seg2891.1/GoldUCD/mRNA.D3Y31 product="Coiled-coil and C2 domain-containing protein 2A" protein_id=Seg2891.1/GoldUCD/D3Y31